MQGKPAVSDGPVPIREQGIEMVAENTQDGSSTKSAARPSRHMRRLRLFDSRHHRLDRLAAIGEGIVNMSHDLNTRLEKLAELQQAQVIMERDIVEAIERLTAATDARR